MRREFERLLFEYLQINEVNPGLIENEIYFRQIANELDNAISYSKGNLFESYEQFIEYAKYMISKYLKVVNGNIVYSPPQVDNGFSQGYSSAYDYSYSLDANGNLICSNQSVLGSKEVSGPNYNLYKDFTKKTFDPAGVELEREYVRPTYNESATFNEVINGNLRNKIGMPYQTNKATIRRNPDIGSAYVSITQGGVQGGTVGYYCNLYGEHIETLDLETPAGGLTSEILGYSSNEELQAKNNRNFHTYVDNIQRPEFRNDSQYFKWVLSEIEIVPNLTTKNELMSAYVNMLQAKIAEARDENERAELQGILIEFSQKYGNGIQQEESPTITM